MKLITLNELYSYVKGDRCLEEGERVQNAKHIMYCAITREDVNSIDLIFLCLRSSDLFGPPVEIIMKIQYPYDHKKKKIDAKCSCPAGLLMCKHVGAAAVHLMKVDKEDIEIATCTDTQQQWGKLKNDSKYMYKTVPLRQFCHGQQKASKFPEPEPKISSLINSVLLPIEDGGSMISKMKTGYQLSKAPKIIKSNSKEIRFLDEETSKSMLSAKIYFPIKNLESILYWKQKNYHYSPFKFGDLSKDEVSFYMKNVSLTVDEAVEINFNTKMQQESAWKINRKNRITASVAYSFLTYLDNNHTPKEWDDKIWKHLHNTFDGNRFTKYGHECENEARFLYEKETGSSVRQSGLVVNPLVPWIGYSPDGLVIDSVSKKVNKILEIKSPFDGKKLSAMQLISKLQYIKMLNGVPTLKENHTFYCQIQLGMFATDSKICDFMIYASMDNSCVIITVPYDKSTVVNTYLPKLRYIYFTYLLKNLVVYKPKSEASKNIFKKGQKNLLAMKRKKLETVINEKKAKKV